MEQIFITKVDVPDIDPQALEVVSEVIENGLIDLGLDVISVAPQNVSDILDHGIGVIPGQSAHELPPEPNQLPQQHTRIP